jgi:hypothetical protein
VALSGVGGGAIDPASHSVGVTRLPRGRAPYPAPPFDAARGRRDDAVPWSQATGQSPRRAEQYLDDGHERPEVDQDHE